MQNNTLQLPDGSLTYHEYGNGKQIWIALHGFAQEGSVFAVLHPYLPLSITLIALDLPWHGASSWTSPTFSLEDMHAAIDALLAKKQATQYSLLGFSFGARLALALSTREAHRWKRLVLLAPDGLPRRDWYAFFDQTPLWAKKSLSGLFNQGPWVLKLAKKMYQWNWLDAYSLKFMRQHLQTAANRARLKGIWLSAAAFPVLTQTSSFLAKRVDLDIQLITGERDAVIPPKAFAYLAQQIPQMRWLKIKDAGHNLWQTRILPAWATKLFEDTHPDTHPE